MAQLRPIVAGEVSKIAKFVNVHGADVTPPNMEAVKAQEAEADAMDALRAEYQDVVGKRAYHGWSAEELRDKIAAAKAEDTE